MPSPRPRLVLPAAADRGSTVLTLSPLDQVMTRGYVHKVFGVPLPDTTREGEAFACVERGLRAVVARWPYVDGIISPAGSEGLDKLRLKLTYEPDLNKKAAPFSLLLHHPQQHDFSLAYGPLLGAGIPPSHIRKEELSALPDHPAPGEECPAFAIQANFIPGGLLLSFSFHHAVFDGVSTRLLFMEFAAAARLPTTTSDAITAITSVAQRLDYSSCALATGAQRLHLDEFAEFGTNMAAGDDSAHEANEALQDLIRKARVESELDGARESVTDPEPGSSTKSLKAALPALTIEEATTPGTHADRIKLEPTLSESHVTCRIFTFTPKVLKALKDNVTAHLSTTANAEAWVSTMDCLCALIWVNIMRARRPRVDRAGTAKFGSAVDIRRRTEPPLPRDYFGNAVVYAYATAPMAEIVDPSKSDIISIISLAACHIRHSIIAVDKEYVSSRIDAYATLADPTTAAIAYKRNLDTYCMGLDFSSWRDQIHGIKFGIAGTSPEGDDVDVVPDFMRKTWAGTAGTCNVLPRTSAEANFEVLLALSEDGMARLLVEGNFMALVEKVVQ